GGRQRLRACARRRQANELRPLLPVPQLRLLRRNRLGYRDRRSGLSERAPAGSGKLCLLGRRQPLRRRHAGLAEASVRPGTLSQFLPIALSVARVTPESDRARKDRRRWNALDCRPVWWYAPSCYQEEYHGAPQDGDR